MIDQSSFAALLPLICLALSSIALITQAAVKRHALSALLITVVGLVAAFISAMVMDCATPMAVGKLLLIDVHTQFFHGIMFAILCVISLYAYDHFAHEEYLEEFFAALLISAIGALVLAASSHFITLFLGLELLTVPLYALIAFHRHEKSLEASIKYLVLAGISSALLLFGLALLYAVFGTMDMYALSFSSFSSLILFYAGMLFVLFGVFFKMGVAPAHTWVADVYEGSPMPVVAYLATISKIAIVALFFRFFSLLVPAIPSHLMKVITLSAAVSMLVGSVLLIKQDNVKRLLAYSSIANFGYVLMAIMGADAVSLNALLFYVIAYASAVLLVLICLRDAQRLHDVRGIFHSDPFRGMMLLIGFLSLLGIPLTSLFLGKVFVAYAGVMHQQYFLLACLVISSGVSIFGYLRVVNILIDKHHAAEVEKISFLSKGLSLTLACMVVLLGVMPQLIIDNVAHPVAENAERQ